MLTLIKSSFIDYKLTILRNKKTSNSLFRQTMNETSYLIAAEVLKHLKYKQTSIQTPLTKTKGRNFTNPSTNPKPARRMGTITTDLDKSLPLVFAKGVLMFICLYFKCFNTSAAIK